MLTDECAFRLEQQVVGHLAAPPTPADPTESLCMHVEAVLHAHAVHTYRSFSSGSPAPEHVAHTTCASCRTCLAACLDSRSASAHFCFACFSSPSELPAAGAGGAAERPWVLALLLRVRSGPDDLALLPQLRTEPSASCLLCSKRTWGNRDDRMGHSKTRQVNTGHG
jgi:hypothetical protein